MPGIPVGGIRRARKPCHNIRAAPRDRCASCNICSAGISRCSASEIAAERKRRQGRLARGLQRTALRIILAMRGRTQNLCSLPASLACRATSAESAAATPASPRSHRHRTFPCRDAIFSDDDIAQMPRDGLVAITPANIGLRLWRRPAASPPASGSSARPQARTPAPRNYTGRRRR